jgi:hypothetical protein
MAADALSKAWITAQAALPHGWAVDGVMAKWTYAAVRSSVPQLPQVSAAFVALASHQSGSDEGVQMWVIGSGDHPAQALTRLAEQLQELRGRATG